MLPMSSSTSTNTGAPNPNATTKPQTMFKANADLKAGSKAELKGDLIVPVTTGGAQVGEDIKSGEMVCLDEVDNKIKRKCAKPMSSSASVNTGAPNPNATT